MARNVVRSQTSSQSGIQNSRLNCPFGLTGFCTPGIIVSIYSLYANSYSMKEIEEHLDGNLCRCTGYRPIWDAARSLCDDAESLVRGPCGTPCRLCPERDECQQDCNVNDKGKAEEEKKDKVVCSSSKDKVAMKQVFVENKDGWLDQPNQMFPKELADATSIENQELCKPLIVVDHTAFHGAGTWFKPSSLEDLLALLREFGGKDGGGYKIVVGNTEVGIGKNVIHHSSCLNLSCAWRLNVSSTLFLFTQRRNSSTHDIPDLFSLLNLSTNFINSQPDPIKLFSVHALH